MEVSNPTYLILSHLLFVLLLEGNQSLFLKLVENVQFRETKDNQFYPKHLGTPQDRLPNFSHGILNLGRVLVVHFTHPEKE